MKKLTSEHYRSMPWKNGLGTTIELVVFPEYAQLDNFFWRISRAQVVADSDFSQFPDIDRTLALLQGNGMRLNVNGQRCQLDQQNNMVSFPGDAKTHAELLNGPISDFNLMSRRLVCSHQLSHWEGESLRQLPINTVFLFCAEGTGKLATANSFWKFDADESALFAASDDVTAYTLECNANSRFYCVQIQLH